MEEDGEDMMEVVVAEVMMEVVEEVEEEGGDLVAMEVEEVGLKVAVEARGVLKRRRDVYRFATSPPLSRVHLHNAFSEENFIGYIVTYLIATALTQRTYYTYQMLSILLQFEKTFANVAGYISPFPFPLPSFGGLFVEFVPLPLPHSIRAETEMFRQFFSQIQ